MRLELRLGSETAAKEVVQHRLDRLDRLGAVESVEPSARQPTLLAADLVALGPYPDHLIRSYSTSARLRGSGRSEHPQTCVNVLAEPSLLLYSAAVRLSAWDWSVIPLLGYSPLIRDAID